MTTKLYRIACNINNGRQNDARMTLEISPAGCDAQGDSLVVSTNAGPFTVDITGSNPGGCDCTIEEACEELACTYAQLREAAIRAFPAAADWDWAYDEISEVQS